MNTIKDNWHVGQPVWAAQGTVGWRPASITHIGRKWIEVIFSTGRRTHGVRPLGYLRPRDPQLQGGDKPNPLRARQNVVMAEALRAEDYDKEAHDAEERE